MLFKKQEQYLLKRLLENIIVIFFITSLTIYLITIFAELRVELAIDSSWAFFYYCFLRFVVFFPYFLHIVFLLSGAITIYVLNKNNELLVMLMSGISSLKVATVYAFMLTILCAVVLVPINIYGGKILMFSETTMKSGGFNPAQNTFQTVWLKEKGKYIYISNSKNNLIEDISIIDVDKDYNPKRIINIKNTKYDPVSKDFSWLGDDIKVYTFDNQNNLHMDTDIKNINLDIDQEIVYLTSLKKIYMDAFELHRYYRYLQENGIYNSSYEIIFKEFFIKYPILFGIFLFSLSFVFRNARTQNLNLSMAQAIGSTIGLFYLYMYLELLNKNIGYMWWLNGVFMSIFLLILNYIVWSKQNKLSS